MRLLLVAAGLFVLVPAARAAEIPVVVVPGLALEDLQALEDRAAVGLLVPGTGPETSERSALAALVRGRLRNSLRGGLPEGDPVIRVRRASTVPRRGPAIVLGLPRGGPQPNDRRYPVALLGRSGLLLSDSTRVPGLVSVVDVAPAALGREGLRVERRESAVGALRQLDRRIVENRRFRHVRSLLAAGLIVLLALVFPRAGLLAFGSLLLANLMLGIAGVSTPWIVLVSVALAVGAVAPLLALLLRTRLALGLALAAVVAAYFVALAFDPTWVALSPLGPTQNGRFHGISNLLETLLLLPVLAAAAFLRRRFGLPAFAVVAALALVTVAGGRFGADGGGAIVLAVSLGTLLVAVARPPLRVLAGGAAALVGLVLVDALAGPSTHVTRSFADGPQQVGSDVVDRLALSWERATAGWTTGLVVALSLLAFALLAGRIRHLPPGEGRALPLAFAGAIAVSLLVNDSPREVALGGAVGLLVAARFAAAGGVRSAATLGAYTIPRS